MDKFTISSYFLLLTHNKHYPQQEYTFKILQNLEELVRNLLETSFLLKPYLLVNTRIEQFGLLLVLFFRIVLIDPTYINYQ